MAPTYTCKVIHLSYELSVGEFRIQQSVDEVTSSFCPYQVHFREDNAMLAYMLACTAPGKPLTGKLSIEHVLSALPVLDAHLAESAVQFLCRHVQFLGQLGGGDAGNGIEHLVGIVGTGFQSGYFLVPSG